ncbi:hypothetical protein NX868_17670 [Burkholderia thailandensis]|nr:hypothetical protein [Burkholderia thailandensis]MCS3393216.1 hypothetical protein [Burkholderia thailandensis]MCS6426210.1 hypothetical protein [Burkholderia thailandensis]MCS6455523.1 hypothetical protein [Burkholderia thailandensis]MCS6465466.1 hypothetical protein [Burkholderia thailandensis]MCS6484099.1 hypothetical protein [Burkholderia thailandensis]
MDAQAWSFPAYSVKVTGGKIVPNETVKITFYKIDQCGYYPWGSRQASFGGISDTFEQLRDWSAGMPLSLTKLFDDGGANDERLPIYLAGIVARGNEWVFATWNEVPAHEGGVASISRDSPVGDPEVHINEIAENSIPGYATYFWVIPQRSLIASIRFVHNVSGQQGMRDYVERFLAREARYVVGGQNEDGENVVVGYAEDGVNLDGVKYPKFKTLAFVKDGPRQYILDNVGRIRRVMRRGHLTVENRVQRTTWEGLVSFIRGRRPDDQPIVMDKSVFVEMEYQPTIDELREIFAREDENGDGRMWDDIGFKFQGEGSKPYWLRRSLASDSFEIYVERRNEEIVDLEVLAGSLNDHRRRILAILE